MRKEDYIRRIMTLYKEYEMNSENHELLVKAPPSKPHFNWQELVDFAADYGIENLEIQDMIRMADLAKDVLRQKTV